MPFTSEKGKQAFYYDGDLKGFGLRVSNTTKTYIAETKVQRKTVRVTLGKHGILAPEQARKLAKEKLAAMAQNINPNAVDRENRIKSITLLGAYRDYMEARKDLKPTTKRDYIKCAEGYLKDWLNKPMAEITRDMVEQKHRSLSEASEARANLAMRFLRALFNFAAEYRDSKGRVILGDNPVRRLSAKKIWNRTELSSLFKNGIHTPYLFNANPLFREALTRAKKDYQLLSRVEWIKKYNESTGHAITSGRKRLTSLICEAQEKNLLIPKEFVKFINERNKSILDRPTLTHKSRPESVKREKNNESKAIGLLAILLARKSNRFIRGETISAKSIKDAICELAEELNIESDGLKSLDRAITDGLKHVESKYEIDLKTAIPPLK